jgi:hypothetical protein
MNLDLKEENPSHSYIEDKFLNCEKANDKLVKN